MAQGAYEGVQLSAKDKSGAMLNIAAPTAEAFELQLGALFGEEFAKKVVNAWAFTIDEQATAVMGAAGASAFQQQAVEAATPTPVQAQAVVQQVGQQVQQQAEKSVKNPGEPPSEKQVALIQKRGNGAIPIPATKGEASKLIEALLAGARS